MSERVIELHIPLRNSLGSIMENGRGGGGDAGSNRTNEELVAGFWEEGSSTEDGRMRREWRGKSGRSRDAA